MVPCEVAGRPLQIRCLPAITTPEPMRPQRQSCLTWLALNQLSSSDVIRTFVPSDRLLFLPSDLIRDRVQEIGRGRADETETRSLAGPGDAIDVPVTVLGHTGISVHGHRPDPPGPALTLPTALPPQTTPPRPS